MLELFKEKHFVGEFFVDNDYSNRFMGEIDYSPDNGVIFSYTITGHNISSETNIIYGVLTTGDKCTLVGNFSPQNSGFTFRNGLNARNGKAKFSYLFIGDFLDEKELLFDINFSLTNLQEFFFPRGYKDLVKFSDKPLFSINTNYGKIEIGNNASFGFLHKDVSAQIYSRNKNALKELNDSFGRLEKKYPDAGFMLKKDISYRIHLKFDAGTEIIPIYGYIREIADLFSILIYGPVYPESIRATKKVDGNYPIIIDIYPSMSFNKRTIELSIKDRSHFNMPITKTNIDLASTIQKWLKAPKNYSTIVSSLQNETELRDEHSLHGELVLYATQFEAISYSASAKNNKYEYPVDNYATSKIKNGIMTILNNAGEINMGKGIGNIRNEIAHVGKPKKLLNILSMKDMAFMSRYLQLTILGYILRKLDLEESVISAYQDKFAPDV